MLDTFGLYTGCICLGPFGLRLRLTQTKLRKSKALTGAVAVSAALGAAAAVAGRSKSAALLARLDLRLQQLRSMIGAI